VVPDTQTPLPQSVVEPTWQSWRQVLVSWAQTKPAAQGQGSPTAPAPGWTQLVVWSATSMQAWPPSASQDDAASRVQLSAGTQTGTSWVWAGTTS
jgi:hypothetical protein